eukprot:7153129-Prorocentrum_lima.AAC.1
MEMSSPDPRIAQEDLAGAGRDYPHQIPVRGTAGQPRQNSPRHIIEGRVAGLRRRNHLPVSSATGGSRSRNTNRGLRSAAAIAAR